MFETAALGILVVLATVVFTIRPPLRVSLATLTTEVLGWFSKRSRSTSLQQHFKHSSAETLARFLESHFTKYERVAYTVSADSNREEVWTRRECTHLTRIWLAAVQSSAVSNHESASIKFKSFTFKRCFPAGGCEGFWQLFCSQTESLVFQMEECRGTTTCQSSASDSLLDLGTSVAEILVATYLHPPHWHERNSWCKNVVGCTANWIYSRITSRFSVCASRLISLDLSGHPIGDRGACLIGSCLENHESSLKKLILNGCSIGEDGGVALGKLLHFGSVTKVTQMRLARNALGCRSIQSILLALRSYDSPLSRSPLQVIDVSNNCLSGEENCIALIQAIPFTPHLRILDMFGNGNSTKLFGMSAMDIVKAIGYHPRLRRLGLMLDADTTRITNEHLGKLQSHSAKVITVMLILAQRTRQREGNKATLPPELIRELFKMLYIQG